MPKLMLGGTEITSGLKLGVDNAKIYLGDTLIAAEVTAEVIVTFDDVDGNEYIATFDDVDGSEYILTGDIA